MITENVILNYVKEKKVRVVYDIRPSNLTFLIGLARCGKSTFTQYIKNIPGIFVQNDDNLRLAWYGKRYSSAGEGFIHTAKYPFIKASILSGYHVVSDDTHTTAQNILRLLAVDNNASFIYFEQDPDICKERAINTDQSDLLPIIDKQFNNLQKTFGGKFDATNMIATVNKLRNLADKPLKDIVEERIVASL